MPPLLAIFVITLAGLLLLAGVLHLIPKLGSIGRPIADRLIRAPGLDLIVFLFTAAPPIVFGILAAAGGLGWMVADGEAAPAVWAVVLVAIGGQCATLIIWSQIHELMAGRPKRDERIFPTLDSIVGPAKNHLAVWWTALAVPVFWFVRLGEWIVYPPLTWWVKLPRYRSREWISVSRQKFDGLVGYDLIWCLYCDWMTGVWSLGGEMLRNVESFWCPIRFKDQVKCDNCKVDFPDVATDWVPHDATMGQVTRLLREKYPGPGGDSQWFGHPARVTVEGKPLASEGDATPKD